MILTNSSHRMFSLFVLYIKHKFCHYCLIETVYLLFFKSTLKCRVEVDMVSVTVSFTIHVTCSVPLVYESTALCPLY